MGGSKGEVRRPQDPIGRSETNGNRVSLSGVLWKCSKAASPDIRFSCLETFLIGEKILKINITINGLSGAVYCGEEVRKRIRRLKVLK